MYPCDLVGAGIFYSMDRLRKLKKISIDPIEEKVSWMDGINLDADVLYEDIASGTRRVLLH
ncbi:MAG: hypothetical protein AAB241_06160 [Pseudomonadota bacterium]